MFQGLSTALTSLYAQRQALETTGNNLANANTEGYTRQRVEMASMGASQWPSFTSTGARSGTGVSVQDIARFRDSFLELRGLQEHANQGELTRLKTTMETVELAFGEPGEDGLQAQLANFWAAWDDVANRPDDVASRSQVVEQAQTLVAVFGQTSSTLSKLDESSRQTLRTTVGSLNAMAQNIGELNESIKSAVNAGVSPNDLLDKRDLLISKMSELATITVQPTESGSVAVLIGGTAIVRDDRFQALQVDDTADPIVLRWDVDKDMSTVTDGFPASLRGGDIGGLMTAINSTIPKYLSQLDTVAASLITTVNTQHALGLDQAGVAGGAFFSGTDASDIAVDAALAADSGLLAAGAAGGGPLDGENARTMADFAVAHTGPDSVYREVVDLMGVEAQRVYNQLNIQTNITNAVDASRQSAAGVNLDEEMANLIRFQKAYNASAKYLSVIDQTLDSLLSIVR